MKNKTSYIIVEGAEALSFGFVPSTDQPLKSREEVIREASSRCLNLTENEVLQIIDTETGHIFDVKQVPHNPRAVLITANATNPCG